MTQCRAPHPSEGLRAVSTFSVMTSVEAPHIHIHTYLCFPLFCFPFWTRLLSSLWANVPHNALLQTAYTTANDNVLLVSAAIFSWVWKRCLVSFDAKTFCCLFLRSEYKFLPDGVNCCRSWCCGDRDYLPACLTRMDESPSSHSVYPCFIFIFGNPRTRLFPSTRRRQELIERGLSDSFFYSYTHPRWSAFLARRLLFTLQLNIPFEESYADQPVLSRFFSQCRVMPSISHGAGGCACCSSCSREFCSC